MKYLLLPSNNSLSHIFKSLAIRDALIECGHEVHLAVCKNRLPFLNKINYQDFHMISDIQENDDAGAPTIHWFKYPEKIIECIQSELNLIKQIKPDRVIGIFKFTAKASSKVAGAFFDSLTCGCMIPDFPQGLGYEPESPLAKQQEQYLNNFYRYAAAKMNVALKFYGLELINDIRSMLKGDRTFLWDFPEFMPIVSNGDLYHIGPIFWEKYPFNGIDIDQIVNTTYPIAVVSFGTTKVPQEVLLRIINILLDMDFRVIYAAGKENAIIKKQSSNFFQFDFAPIHKLLAYASLVVSHGGQMTIFESLLNKVPVVVMPFQPEQLHNGLCLEKIGCGKRLIIPKPFRGNMNIYLDALNALSNNEIQTIIGDLKNNPHCIQSLDYISGIIKTYDGAKTIAKHSI